MLERMEDLPHGIDGVKAVGRLTKEDYETVFRPLVEDARREDRRLRLVYEIGPAYRGFTPRAAWQDAKLGFSSMQLFDGIAVVTDIRWMRAMTRLVRAFMPCPVKVFGAAERERAIDWLASLPVRAPVEVGLVEGTDVIAVEARSALRVRDFDRVTELADACIARHGSVQGLVIHAREFPGWASMAAMRAHARLVRKYRRSVERFAVATDSKLATVGPTIARLLSKAEVKAFAFDELDMAIAWARGPAERSTEPEVIEEAAFIELVEPA